MDEKSLPIISFAPRRSGATERIMEQRVPVDEIEGRRARERRRRGYRQHIKRHVTTAHQGRTIKSIVYKCRRKRSKCLLNIFVTQITLFGYL